MKIAICDDITEYRLSIKCYVAEYFRLKNIECDIMEFKDGKSLIDSDMIYDIVFLDIELGDMNGIDVAKNLQERNFNTVVLIVTSYRQYLDDAMDINVTRYIEKPVIEEKVFSALDKAMEIINEKIITLHTKDNQIIRIKVKNIAFVESKLKKTFVYTIHDKFVVKESLKYIRELLTAICFATPHNSYVVNLNQVVNFQREEVSVKYYGGIQKIQISTRKQPQFKRKFLDFIGEDY